LEIDWNCLRIEIKGNKVNVSVVGLGKLGLCTAACFASKGHNVTGVEKNTDFVDKLQSRCCPIDETGLDELLESSWDNLTVTMDIEEAVSGSDITLIIVPTPSKAYGRFTNEYVETVLRSIGPEIRTKDNFHVVDVVSTVMPGSCDKIFKPLLEELSDKVCGKDFGLVYNPEFIALGSVVRDFLNPDMVLIGASDEHSSAMVKELYASTCDSSPEIVCMSLVNAEITKLSLNCFVTMKISYANELASICERIPGADVDVVTNAIGADSRVGKKYLKGGLGFGGPCFPRDNLAFQKFAEDAGIQAKLSPQVVAVNNAVVDRMYAIVRERCKIGGKVAVVGLSYKQGTCICEESQAIMLAQKLVDAGYNVRVHDPKALDNAKDVLGESVGYYDDVYECVVQADAVVMMTDLPGFRELDWKAIEEKVRNGAVLIDSWRGLKNKQFSGFDYTGLGLGERQKKAVFKC
jgi:UDPglucose 6-dehydrogenase